MGHADNAFRQDQQRVAAGDPIIGLGGVIGIPGAGKAMNAPGGEGKRSLSVSMRRELSGERNCSPPPPPQLLVPDPAARPRHLRDRRRCRFVRHQARTKLFVGISGCWIIAITSSCAMQVSSPMDEDVIFMADETLLTLAADIVSAHVSHNAVA
jgi:hypothetical protein